MHRLLRLHYFDSVNNNSAGRDLFAFKGDPFAHGILGLPPLLRDPRAVFVPSALSKRKLCDDGWHDLDGLEEAEGPRAGKMHVRSLPPEEFMHEIYRPMSKHPCYAVPMPIGCHEGPDSPTRLLNNSQLQQQLRPTVITCAPPSREPRHSTTMKSPSPSEHKHEASSYDHVVEEHFRRSLAVVGSSSEVEAEVSGGTNPACVSVTGSVDEHFAKALGDTWHRLKLAGDAATCPLNLPTPRPISLSHSH
uniref:transcription cofactor vestigial-like protein 4 isoform X2 n=1 Tax=Myxine glutinosa TaxID=7769 RepID=UPI00358F47AB